MQPRHVVVIGASAGGIDTLRPLVSALPGDFPAAIAIVLHVSPQSPGIVHDILARCRRARSPTSTPITWSRSP